MDGTVEDREIRRRIGSDALMIHKVNANGTLQSTEAVRGFTGYEHV